MRNKTENRYRENRFSVHFLLNERENLLTDSSAPKTEILKFVIENSLVISRLRGINFQSIYGRRSRTFPPKVTETCLMYI